MIRSIRDKETEKVWIGERSVRLPEDIQRNARKKLRMLNNAQNFNDLRIPPANRLEKMKRKRSHQYSIRINDQWRLCFEWHEGDAYDVEIVDYHKEK